MIVFPASLVSLFFYAEVLLIVFYHTKGGRVRANKSKRTTDQISR